MQLFHGASPSLKSAHETFHSLRSRNGSNPVGVIQEQKNGVDQDITTYDKGTVTNPLKMSVI